MDDARGAAVREALDAFEAAWSEGDRRAIYAAALAGWRAWPAPELAELMGRCADGFGGAMAASASVASWKRRFLERARAAEPFEIAGLLRSLTQQRLPRTKLAACLVELPTAPRDPAVGRAALELAIGSRHDSLGGSAWGVIDRRLIVWAESSGDARLVSAIAAWRVRLEQASRADAYAAKLLGWITHAQDALRGCEAPPLPGAEAERVARLVARFDGPVPRASRAATKAAPTVLEALEREVMERPGDDGALAVWSDALQRVEDPRGELIALQLAGTLDEKRQRRVDKLIAANWRAWLGPIASAVVPGSVVFERGLFAACTTRALRASQVSIFSHPGWATVRRINFGGAGALTATMRQLEEVRALPAGALARCERLVFPALRSLEITLQLTWLPRALMRLTGVPALRKLALRAASSDVLSSYAAGGDGTILPPFPYSAEVYGAVFQAPFAAQLEQLELPLDWRDARWTLQELARIGAELRARAPRLRSLALYALGGGTLALDLEGRTGTVLWSVRPSALERGRAVTKAFGLRFVASA